MSHVFLHVALCSAIARQKPETVVAMNVRLLYPVGNRPGGTQLEKTFTFERGDATETVVEFDVPRGIYSLELDVPKYRCATSDFLAFLPDHDRTIAETLSDGGPPSTTPVLLMQGTAPSTFLSVKPTYVLFDKSLTCNQPVSTQLQSHIVVENDPDAYYVWLYSDSGLEARGQVVVALRLRTATGLYHYVRVPIPFPTPWGGWPGSVQFNVTEDEIDGLATEKTDALLCPKLWQTSVGGQSAKPTP